AVTRQGVVAGAGKHVEITVLAARAGRRAGVVRLGVRAGAPRQSVTRDDVVVLAAVDQVAAGGRLDIEPGIITVLAVPRTAGIGLVVGRGVAALIVIDQGVARHDVLAVP